MKWTIVRQEQRIHAPINRCFALSTEISIVQQTLGFTPSPASGQVKLNDRVLWSGRMFGITHTHGTLITGYNAPHFFEDSQEHGRFASFAHAHHLREVANGTELHDEVRFTLPWWMGGALTARLIMKPRIEALLKRRFALLKSLAEAK